MQNFAIFLRGRNQLHKSSFFEKGKLPSKVSFNYKTFPRNYRKTELLTQKKGLNYYNQK